MFDIAKTKNNGKMFDRWLKVMAKMFDIVSLK